MIQRNDRDTFHGEYKDASTLTARYEPKTALTAVLRTLGTHWHLYLFEELELAIFMLSACAFTYFLFDSSSRAVRIVQSAIDRRALMGIAMGVTATPIIRSPMGKRSGAHFNPAITLTYWLLNKIAATDALLYMVGQFAGAIFGVWVAKLPTCGDHIGCAVKRGSNVQGAAVGKRHARSAEE